MRSTPPSGGGNRGFQVRWTLVFDLPVLKEDERSKEQYPQTRELDGQESVERTAEILLEGTIL